MFLEILPNQNYTGFGKRNFPIFFLRFSKNLSLEDDFFAFVDILNDAIQQGVPPITQSAIEEFRAFLIKTLDECELKMKQNFRV